MSIVDFSWPPALAGGALIGLAAGIMMVFNGKIAGISGIFANLLHPRSSTAWQWAFIMGLLISGLLSHWLISPIQIDIKANTPMLIIAGLLVGFGTRLGNGCTSGHGVCGISRFSIRALIATLTFICSGVVTVYLLSFMSKGI
jgi:uncharacterized membrane protein YedE/YeeE